MLCDVFDGFSSVPLFLRFVRLFFPVCLFLLLSSFLPSFTDPSPRSHVHLFVSVFLFPSVVVFLSFTRRSVSVFPLPITTVVVLVDRLSLVVLCCNVLSCVVVSCFVLLGDVVFCYALLCVVLCCCMLSPKHLNT